MAHNYPKWPKNDARIYALFPQFLLTEKAVPRTFSLLECMLESKANIDLSEEVGRSFVKYLYTGELEENILKEQTLAFLELGQKYDIQELKDLAEQELLEQLDRKNMVEFVFMGDLFSAEKIFEAALKMTKANMSWLRNQV